MSSTVVARRPLLPWLLAASVAAGAVFGIQLARDPHGLLGLPLYDYVAFWAAGRLNAAGEDPYDPARLEDVERQASPGIVDVLVMWPAPWALALLAPFARLDPHSGHLLWQLAQLGVLLAAIEVLWRHWGGDPQRRLQVGVAARVHLPAELLPTGNRPVRGGHPARLRGLPPLHAPRPGSAGRRVPGAGGGQAPADVPLLDRPAAVGRGGSALQRGGRLGGVVAVLALLLLPVWENPHLPANYWEALTRRTQTHSHLSPLAGTALRLMLAPHSLWPQFLPLVPGLLWLAWYWRRYRRNWDWSERLPALLFASFLAAPYGAWPFDLVVFLLPLLGAAVRLNRRVAAADCSGSRLSLVDRLRGVGSSGSNGVEYFWFLWMTPALAAVLLLLRLAPRTGTWRRPKLRRRILSRPDRCWRNGLFALDCSLHGKGRVAPLPEHGFEPVQRHERS